MSEHTKTYKQILILKIEFSFSDKLQKLVQSEKCCRCELKTDFPLVILSIRGRERPEDVSPAQPVSCFTILITAWGTQSQRSTDSYDLYYITISQIRTEDPQSSRIQV